MSGVLLASNEPSTAKVIGSLLRTAGYKVSEATDKAVAQEAIRAQDLSLLILTTGKEWDSKLELAGFARTEKPAMPCIVIVDRDDGETLARVEAFKPFAFFCKPLRVEELLKQVQKGVDFIDESLKKEVDLNLQLETFYRFDNLVADSPAMRSVCDMASRVASTDVPVVIMGEAGTGRGTLARAIHDTSARKEGSFVAVACSRNSGLAALTGTGANRGNVEKADAGTLVLRDIDALDAEAQLALARFYEGKKVSRQDSSAQLPVDFRLIATTAMDLQKLVAGGQFNASLYGILKTFLIRIPPLRSRPEDILPIVLRLFRRMASGGRALPSLDREVVEALKRHSWPGNVSEMETVLAHAYEAAHGGTVTMACLPSRFGAASGQNA